MHARLEAWAEAGWSTRVVLAWGLVQGSFFPGLADLFFLPLAIARPSRAYQLAFYSAAGTILGGVTLYWLGAGALEWLQGPVAELFGMTETRLDAVRASLARWGPWAILLATISPLSVKLTSIMSGALGVAFLPFLLALAVGRFGRVFVFAWLIRNGGADAVARWARIPLSRP